MLIGQLPALKFISGMADMASNRWEKGGIMSSSQQLTIEQAISRAKNAAYRDNVAVALQLYN